VNSPSRLLDFVASAAHFVVLVCALGTRTQAELDKHERTPAPCAGAHNPAPHRDGLRSAGGRFSSQRSYGSQNRQGGGGAIQTALCCGRDGRRYDLCRARGSKPRMLLHPGSQTATRTKFILPSPSPLETDQCKRSVSRIIPKVKQDVLRSRLRPDLPRLHADCRAGAAAGRQDLRQGACVCVCVWGGGGGGLSCSQPAAVHRGSL
jgi:hypothetical protein